MATKNEFALGWPGLAAGLLVLLVTMPPTARGFESEPEPVGGPFAQAIEYAQARTVKIYGAGIGREPGYATGIVISPTGQILAAQGIYLAGERIRVVMPDGSTHLAKVERRSNPLQVALLKIEAKTPKYFELSEKPVVDPGDWVIGVSNAFKVATGQEKLSVNLGVVSLRTRLEAKRGTQDFTYDGQVLLIDAITSNPGAQGGSLVTAEGKLAGMIGKIIESKSTRTRLNYAVPAELLFKFVAGKPLGNPIAETASGGKAVLGIRLFKLAGKRAPAYIDRVLSKSPAAKAGLKADDLILAVGQSRIRNVGDYEKVLRSLVPGKPVQLLVKRKQKLLKISLTPAGNQ